TVFHAGFGESNLRNVVDGYGLSVEDQVVAIRDLLKSSDSREVRDGMMRAAIWLRQAGTSGGDVSMEDEFFNDILSVYRNSNDVELRSDAIITLGLMGGASGRIREFLVQEADHGDDVMLRF